MNDEWFTKEQLHFVAQDGDLSKVKTLVDCGYDVNAFDEDCAFTPLHYAAMGEHIEVMKYLISVGADVNAHNPDVAGETPLGQVAQNCSFEVARILIEAGADPTIPGWMQISALYRASKRERTEGLRVYELLLSVAKERFHHQSPNQRSLSRKLSHFHSPKYFHYTTGPVASNILAVKGQDERFAALRALDSQNVSGFEG